MEVFHYHHACLFGLIMFVLLWQNSHLQPQCIYLFPPVSPVQNMRSLVTCVKYILRINPIGQLRDVSNISSTNFFVGIHTCHTRIYFLWLIFFCTFVWALIYFCWLLRTSFRVVRVPVKFLFTIFGFGKYEI